MSILKIIAYPAFPQVSHGCLSEQGKGNFGKRRLLHNCFFVEWLRKVEICQQSRLIFCSRYNKLRTKKPRDHKSGIHVHWNIFQVSVLIMPTIAGTLLCGDSFFAHYFSHLKPHPTAANLPLKRVTFRWKDETPLLMQDGQTSQQQSRRQTFLPSANNSQVLGFWQIPFRARKPCTIA